MAEVLFLTCGFSFREHSSLTFAFALTLFFWKDETVELLVSSREVESVHPL